MTREGSLYSTVNSLTNSLGCTHTQLIRIHDEPCGHQSRSGLQAGGLAQLLARGEGMKRNISKWCVVKRIGCRTCNFSSVQIKLHTVLVFFCESHQTHLTSFHRVLDLSHVLVVNSLRTRRFTVLPSAFWSSWT